jgi:phosphoribosyl 1,2-cyclic phosphodiesterase
LLVTHEHGDHSRGIRPFTRKRRVPVWATPGTAQVIDAIDDYERIRSGRELTIGSIDVRPVPVPHDAREPCQFVFRAGGLQFGLLTDTGHATPVIREALRDCDALAIEFNHDRRMLANGRYPEAVKARVGSKFGHLSNEQTVALIEDVAHDGLNWVMGLHLSEQNNSPDCVRASAARITERSQVELRLASQNEPSPWLEVARC